MGVLMLMAMATPSAHAVTLLAEYYNFNTEADGTPPPYTSNTTFGGQTTHLINDATNPVPLGNLSIDATAGTTIGQWPADGTGAGGALDIAGNANLNIGSKYCFDFGGISTTGLTSVTLSFALASVGNGGQFSMLDVAWGTSTSATVAPATFPNSVALTSFTIGTNTSDRNASYTLNGVVTGALTGADNLSSTMFVWVQFCFSGAKNNANGNDTFVDNISVTGVPEPTTVIGGMLAAIGLCWNQRKRLSGIVRARLA